MIRRKEGPLERKFWILVGVLTFGPIAIFLGAGLLGWLSGEGGAGFAATAPLMLFGMTMVGIIVFGFSLWEAIKGKADWLTLALGGMWLFFFGRAFLQMVWVEF